MSKDTQGVSLCHQNSTPLSNTVNNFLKTVNGKLFPIKYINLILIFKSEKFVYMQLFINIFYRKRTCVLAFSFYKHCFHGDMCHIVNYEFIVNFCIYIYPVYSKFQYDTCPQKTGGK